MEIKLTGNSNCEVTNAKHLQEQNKYMRTQKISEISSMPSTPRFPRIPLCWPKYFLLCVQPIKSNPPWIHSHHYPPIWHHWVPLLSTLLPLPLPLPLPLSLSAVVAAVVVAPATAIDVAPSAADGQSRFAATAAG